MDDDMDGMYDFFYFEVLGNKDQTEGKGGYSVKKAFPTEEAAVNWARSDEGRHHCGVMGHGYGEVQFVGFQQVDDGTVHIERRKVWGYRKNWADKWDYGYIDNRDAPINDPEYHEYMRLKARFER